MRRAAIVSVAAVIVLGGVLAGLVVAGAFGQDSNEVPPEELAFQTAQAARQATAEAGPHATKAPITLAPSCPNPNALNPKTGIFPQDPRYQPPPPFKGPVQNIATAIADNGIAYTIVAGALVPEGLPESQRWFLEVVPIEPDPCAISAGLAVSHKSGLYEVGPGPVTLTQIDGDTIVFQAADGTMGRLDYVTGTFIDTPADATAVPTGSETPVAGQ